MLTSRAALKPSRPTAVSVTLSLCLLARGMTLWGTTWAIVGCRLSLLNPATSYFRISHYSSHSLSLTLQFPESFSPAPARFNEMLLKKGIEGIRGRPGARHRAL